MKKQNTYQVNIDMKWSEKYTIKAGSATEAKKKAWEKFKKNSPKNLFEILANKESDI